MDRDRVSARQLITLTFAALLSPAIRVLPGRTAKLAGEGGWLAALAALPAALGLCWVLSALLSKVTSTKAHSPLLDGLSVGRYNKQFRPLRTSADWISRDEAVVDAYRADPLCRFLPTVGMYHDMMVGLQLLARPENLRRMDPDTPVLFFSGDRDPVGANGAGVKKVAGWFKDAGVKDLTVTLYPGGRHEMLNETNRDEVYAHVLEWLEGCLPGGAPHP